MNKRVLFMTLVLSFVVFMPVVWAGSLRPLTQEEVEVGKQCQQAYESQHSTYEATTLTQSLADIEFQNPGRGHAQVKVSNEKTLNAFTYPGGYIYITEEMLDFTKQYGDVQVFVLAHEREHFNQAHYQKTIEKEANNQLLAAVVGVFAKFDQTQMQALQNLAATVVHRGFGFDKEREADEKAFYDLLNTDGMNPAGGAVFFTLLMDYENSIGGVQDNYEYPHPKTPTRYQRQLDLFEKSTGGLLKVDGTKVLLDGKVVFDSATYPTYANAPDELRKIKTLYVAGNYACLLNRSFKVVSTRYVYDQTPWIGTQEKVLDSTVKTYIVHTHSVYETRTDGTKINRSLVFETKEQMDYALGVLNKVKQEKFPYDFPEK